jgi:O-antigen chain-terminating methyltransferase
MTLPAFHSSPGDAWPTSDAEPKLDQFLAKQRWSDEVEETESLYTSLELVLRGAEELIQERQRQYLPILQIPERNQSLPILDIGCGRGEFLTLLRECGTRVIGVDLQATDIDRLREKGYDVYHGDGVGYLETLPDASLAGITAFQVIEHLRYDYLRRLLKLAHSKLAPGGLILLETVNSDCVTAFRSFYLDPTHENPIPKYLLAVLLRFYGFHKLNVLYQNPVSPSVTTSDPDWSKYYETYAILGWK